MNTDLNTKQLLQAILDELRIDKQQLGFGHPPKPRYIYANRQYSDCLWYFWNGALNEHEPITFHALTGVFERLEIEEKEFRGKPDPKVNLRIRADRAYIVQAGYETLFARGLLYNQILHYIQAQLLRSAEFRYLRASEAAYNSCSLVNGYFAHKGYKVLPYPTNSKCGYYYHGLKFELETGRLVRRSNSE